MKSLIRLCNFLVFYTEGELIRAETNQCFMGNKVLFQRAVSTAGQISRSIKYLFDVIN